MMVIRIVGGPHQGQSYELAGDAPVVVGRRGSILLNDRKLSRQHARLIPRGDDEWVLEDLDSTNGTYLNQRRLSGAAPLRSGDTVRMGLTTFVFTARAADAPPPPGHNGAKLQSIVSSPDLPEDGETAYTPAPPAAVALTPVDERVPAEQEQAPPPEEPQASFVEEAVAFDPQFRDMTALNAIACPPVEPIAGPVAEQVAERDVDAEPAIERPSSSSEAEVEEAERPSLESSWFDESPLVVDEPEAPESPGEAQEIAVDEVPLEPRLPPPESAAPAAPAPPAEANEQAADESNPPSPPGQLAPAQRWADSRELATPRALAPARDLDGSRQLGIPLPPGWPPQPAGRRVWPYVLLVAIIAFLVVNILLNVTTQQQTRREIVALRQALEQNQQQTAELLIDQVRRELRSMPAPDDAQALRDLNSVISDQSLTIEQRNRELADELRQGFKEQQRQFAQARPTTSDSSGTSAILSELRDLRASVDRLRATQATAQASAVHTSAAATAPAVAEQASPAAAPAEDPAVQAREKAAQAAARARTVYLVDASEGLKNSIPETMVEVRRIISSEPADEPSRVLMLYSNRLVQIARLSSPGARDDSAASRDDDVVDLGPSDLTDAIEKALESHPRTLYLFSDTLQNGEGARRTLRDLNRTATRVNVTQFYSRHASEALKSIARENDGIYTFIPSP